MKGTAVTGERKADGGLHTDRNAKPSFSDSTNNGKKGLVGLDFRKNFQNIRS